MLKRRANGTPVAYQTVDHNGRGSIWLAACWSYFMPYKCLECCRPIKLDNEVNNSNAHVTARGLFRRIK